MSEGVVATVKCADNGGCGECACPCHTDVEDPGPTHLPTCKFADPAYVPPDFTDKVFEAVAAAMDAGATLDEACTAVAKKMPEPPS